MLHTYYRYNCKIVGPSADKSRIPGIDIPLKDGDTWKFGNLTMNVYDTPGHTSGHITLYFPEAGCLFPGEFFNQHQLLLFFIIIVLEWILASQMQHHIDY